MRISREDALPATGECGRLGVETPDDRQ